MQFSDPPALDAATSSSSRSQRLVDYQSTAPGKMYSNGGIVEQWRKSVRDDYLRAHSKVISSSRSGSSAEISDKSTSTKENDAQNGINDGENGGSSSSSPSLPHPGSTSEAKFQCGRCNSVYHARLRERNDPQQDRGCPVCVRIKAAECVLQQAYPELAAEWDAANNARFTSLDPSTVQVDSDATVWWNCALCYGQFVASVKQRVKGDAKCPSCVATGLDPTIPASTRDRLIQRERHFRKKPVAAATTIDKSQSTASSASSVIRNPLNKIEQALDSSAARGLWSCSKCGDTWTGASHRQRAREGTLCPACSGKTLTRSNSLIINRPDVVRNLAPLERQSAFRYQTETTLSQRLLRFLCGDCNREYEMAIRARCALPAGRNGCPHCASAKRTLAVETAEYRRGGAGVNDRLSEARRLSLEGQNDDVSMRAAKGYRSPLNDRPLGLKRLQGPH